MLDSLHFDRMNSKRQPFKKNWYWWPESDGNTQALAGHSSMHEVQYLWYLNFEIHL